MNAIFFLPFFIKILSNQKKKESDMPAPFGNDFHLAIKDPEIRKKAYKSYCDHLAKGKVADSWYYEDDEGNACTARTMLSYIKKFPNELLPIQKEISEKKGYQLWEDICEKSADGSNRKANTASLQMVMRNKFKWDKEDKTTAIPPQADLIDIQNENMILKAKLAALESN